MKKINIFITVVLVTLILAALYTGLKKESVANIGDEAPNFELTNIDGSLLALEEFKGKPIVLNFFTSWCQPCLDEAPELIEFGTTNEDAILLHIGKGETSERIKNFKKITQSDLPFYLQDGKEEVSKQFGVVGQPTTIVIDQDGIIREVINGPVTNRQLTEIVQKMM